MAEEENTSPQLKVIYDMVGIMTDVSENRKMTKEQIDRLKAIETEADKKIAAGADPAKEGQPGWEDVKHVALETRLVGMVDYGTPDRLDAAQTIFLQNRGMERAADADAGIREEGKRTLEYLKQGVQIQRPLKDQHVADLRALNAEMDKQVIGIEQSVKEGKLDAKKAEAMIGQRHDIKYAVYDSILVNSHMFDTGHKLTEQETIFQQGMAWERSRSADKDVRTTGVNSLEYLKTDGYLTVGEVMETYASVDAATKAGLQNGKKLSVDQAIDVAGEASKNLRDDQSELAIKLLQADIKKAEEGKLDKDRKTPTAEELSNNPAVQEIMKSMRNKTELLDDGKAYGEVGNAAPNTTVPKEPGVRSPGE